jgi:hypothetical protein
MPVAALAAADRIAAPAYGDKAARKREGRTGSAGSLQLCVKNPLIFHKKGLSDVLTGRG